MVSSGQQPNVSPAGGRQKRRSPQEMRAVYWRRRLILLVVVVCVVALAVWGVQSFLTYRKALKHQQIEAMRRAAQAAQVIEPVACPLDKMQTSIKLSQAGVNPGKDLIFTVELHNPSTTQPCYMQASNKIYGIQISTGNKVVYDSTKCHANDPDMKILMAADDRYDRKFPWKAVSYSSQCKEEKNLLPGTYKVRSIVDGKVRSDDVTFEIH